MRKVTTVEIFIDGEMFGHTPLLKGRNKKERPRMILDTTGRPTVFPTPKEAKAYGVWMSDKNPMYRKEF